MTTSTTTPGTRAVSIEVSLPQSTLGRASGPVRAVYHRGDRISLLLADGSVLALTPGEARRIVRVLGPNLAGCDVRLDGTTVSVTREMTK